MPSTPLDVKSIFGRALEIESPAGRSAYLDAACGPNAGLRAEIEGLLATLARAGEFMRRPAAVIAAGGTASHEPMSEGPGARVGPYKLLQQIGEGGMGVVYMAEQEEPVRRKVALKIIKPGMDSKQVVARFEAERQALAMMDHTNIARVFDAGTTESGRPYFVMELVHGVPITTYCDENKLTPRKRLELFVPVCHAIQHAHQKGIIHRDLKPSNILVTMYDDRPVPKVIDFGVAKAVEQRLTEKTLFTQFGTLVGTFEYMSPEQAELNAFGVDTRSDIYSLGVLLYELLTGTTPLERSRLREAAFDEIRRIIKEEEPPRPSVRLSTSGTLAKVAAARKTDPAKLSRLVRGELDWMVMRCLEKDRTRRYDTASGLARDVERYLRDEPVEARPPSSGYRLRKFVRRNRGPVAAAFTIAALVMLGAVASTWQAVRAMRAEHDAVVQRNEATEQRNEATEQRNEATEQRNEATEQRREAETAREQLRRTLYHADLNLAQAAWEGGRTAEVLQLLDREKTASPDLCGFEWHYWMRQCHGELATLKLRDLRNWAGAVFSADGSRFTALNLGRAEPAKGRYAIWETSHGREVASFAFPDNRYFGDVVLSDDGTRLAMSLGYMRPDGKYPTELVIMDATTGRRLAASGLPGTCRWVVFCPDGKQVAAVVLASGARGADLPSGELIICDAATGRQLRAIPDIKGHGPRPAFSPDGARIALVAQKTKGGFESEVKAWDIATGKLVLALPVAFGGDRSRTSVAFSPDGKTLAAVGPASPTHIELHGWDVASGRQRFTIQRPFQWHEVRLAFSPDGRWITCAGNDTRVGLWDAATGKELAMYRGHTANVSAVAFSRDGQHLLSADATGSVKVWDAHSRADEQTLNLGGMSIYTAVSPDARRIATFPLRQAEEVKVWDLTGKQLLSLKRSTVRKNEGNFNRTLVFSPKGDRLAFSSTTSSDGALDGANVRGGLTVWDAAGKELLNLDEEGVGFGGVALSPDGTRVAAASSQGDWKVGSAMLRVRVWEIATGRQLLTSQATAGPGLSALTFSPDGTRLAVVCGSVLQPSQVLVWDATTGSECARWQGPIGMGNGIAFSPDGRRVAATVSDHRDLGELMVGDMVSGGLMKLGRAHGSVVFSPDGTRLAAYSALLPQPAEVSMWDVATGRQLLVLKGHRGISATDAIAFSPNGDRIVSTANLVGLNALEVKMWDATPLPRTQ
jgi:serine/threonine protein kinase/WD40 repeat protein